MIQTTISETSLPPINIYYAFCLLLLHHQYNLLFLLCEGIARPNNVELYMMRVPGSPGPYLFVTTRGRRQRPLAVSQALSRPLESQDNQVEEAAPQSVVYERDQEDAAKKPAYFSQTGAYLDEPSDLNDDYLDQYFYNGPQYYSQQAKPALTKIFPSDKSDSNRQILNSRSTLKHQL